MPSNVALRTSLLALGLLLACAAPALAGQSELPTTYSLLIGHPESGGAARGSVLIVPGTQIPPLEGPGELSDKLREAYQLDSVSLNTRYEEAMVVDRTADMPTTVPGLRVEVTLLGFNTRVATYRVVLKHDGEMLADTPVSVKRGGRAVVGSRDGDAAPYLFVVIGTEQGSATAETTPNAPRLIKRVNPTYPDEARRQMIQGPVALRLMIEHDGSCRILEVAESPHPLLAEAAKEAVGQWRYEPPVDETGKPINIEFTVMISFNLQ